MPRKPAHLLPAGCLSSRDRVWAAIRTLKQFTLTDIWCKARVHQATSKPFVDGLVRAGYVRELGSVNFIAKSAVVAVDEMLYELARDAGVIAPRVRRDGSAVTQGLGREQLWRTARILKEFDARELALAASTDRVRVAHSEANHYCSYLQRAGYFAIARASKPGTAARYRFVPARYTGPRAPMIQRVRQVYDPNLGEVTWAQDAREVADASL